MDRIITLHQQQALTAAADLTRTATAAARQLHELAAIPLSPQDLSPHYMAHAVDRLRLLDEQVAEALAVWERRMEATRLWAEGQPESVILDRLQEL